MFTKLTIENFTVFKRATFEFSPGINVLVGENASGKTHLMKLLYAIQKAQEAKKPDAMAERLLGTFRPESIVDLIRQGAPSAHVTATAKQATYTFEIQRDAPGFAENAVTDKGLTWPDVNRPVYIPVKDMLGHSVGFLSLYDQRDIDFEEIYHDILSQAFRPLLREKARTEVEPLLKALERKMEGRVEIKGERFYLVSEGRRLDIHLVAEGWRKLALLYQLIANGSLGPGSVLFWDEPETNLNPSLMDEVIGTLLAVARTGTQIFLATHNYLILKELELQAQLTDNLQLFALARKDGAVTVKPAGSYSELNPNRIADQFERIYDLEIERALGGK